MKFSLPTLGLLFLAVFGLARAQDDEQSGNPDEVITDFGIEEYISNPQFNLSIGVRSLSGAKSAFSGRGFVSSFQPGSDITTGGATRIYHDGNTLANRDDYSFTVINTDGSTSTYTTKPTPAGFTNTWSFLDTRQIREDGNIDFHSYAADVVDSGLRTKNPETGYGMELVVARDMGTLGRKMEWKLLFGASLTDIKAYTTDTLAAEVTSITDTYVPNLNGQTALPSTAPYTAPSFRQVPKLDDEGQPVLDGGGNQVFVYEETTIWLTDHPLVRTTTLTPGTVFTEWDLKGAYFTFRLGPSLSYVINSRLRLTLSAGAALVYSGTEYIVTQTYQPETSDALVSEVESDEARFLAGYYFDATLQFDITDRAGIYAGMVYQDTGSYTQTAEVEDEFTGSHASYKALVDLSGLSGFRMGMVFKF